MWMSGNKKTQAPKQARSQKSLQRMLDATERLLASQPFEHITIAEIVRESKTSTGVFYSRFESKESLLHALYDRYSETLREQLEDALKQIDEESNSLQELSKAIVSLIVQAYRKSRWLMRALGLYSRTYPELIDTDQRAERKSFHQSVAAYFDSYRDEISQARLEHVEFGLFFVAATAREKILFGEAPHASSTEMSDEELTEQLALALVSYLKSSETSVSVKKTTTKNKSK